MGHVGKTTMAIHTITNNACILAAAGGHGNFHEGCRYRTFVEDHASLSSSDLTLQRSQEYLEHSTDATKSLSGWLHLANLTPEVLSQRKERFLPCPY